MMSSGILYVATLEDLYLEEAFLSADSVKQHCPHLPVVLFTDRPQHPLCAARAFDEVRVVEAPSDFKMSCAQGKLMRLHCLPRTPFQRSLHLDADTRVLSDELPRLFELLENFDVGMVEASHRDSYARRHFGQPMFCGGFVLYRRNETTFSWLGAWARIAERNFRLAMRSPVPVIPSLTHIADDDTRRALLNMDQVALAETLSPEANSFGLRVSVVDYSWLHRSTRISSGSSGPARIRHSRKQESDARALELKAVVARRYKSLAL